MADLLTHFLSHISLHAPTAMPRLNRLPRPLKRIALARLSGGRSHGSLAVKSSTFHVRWSISIAVTGAVIRSLPALVVAAPPRPIKLGRRQKSEIKGLTTDSGENPCIPLISLLLQYLLWGFTVVAAPARHANRYESSIAGWSLRSCAKMSCNHLEGTAGTRGAARARMIRRSSAQA
ncbi:MAG TPA: hypothetical protein VNS79_09830 [Sphingobium sp.]|nr:hypothetical protein [Sphingobium sp.]